MKTWTLTKTGNKKELVTDEGYIVIWARSASIKRIQAHCKNDNIKLVIVSQ